MPIRPYQPSDRCELRRAFERSPAAGTAFPDPEQVNNCLTLVSEERGQIAGMVTLRTTLELGGFVDSSFGSARERFQCWREGLRAAVQAAALAGADECHSPIQPDMLRYGRRLEEEGFLYDRRRWYSFDLFALRARENFV